MQPNTQSEKIHTITALSPQVKKTWRTSIFIDGQFWRGYDTEVVAELGLHQGQQLTTSELEAIDHSIEKKRAINRAVLLLSYRSRSVHEVADRLAKAGFVPSIVAEAIEDLKRLDYLNDDTFAHSWMKSRMGSKLYGERRIKQELKLKGISDEVITKSIDENTSPEDEYERAKTLAESKLSSSSYKSLDRNAAFRRLSQFLMRRGYNSSIAYDVCKNLLRDSHSSTD